MSGVFFGVGVGPGDPELLTLAAVRVIGRCPVIAVPESGSREQVALQIAREHITGQELLPLKMPMTRDKEVLRASHQEAARTVCARLQGGQDVAFLTLGDPTVYSTYLYLHRLVLAEGYEARIIPGIPSFCAAAAALNTGLCEGAEPLHILPASYDGVEQYLEMDGAKVLMKSGKKAQDVLALLEKRGLLGRTQLVERCGLPGQRVLHNVEGYEGSGEYFTTILVK